MQTEYEATFINIDKDEIREKLKKVGAILVKPEILMKRYIFYLPQGHDKPGAFVRVRDEGDKITMSFKVIARGGSANIEDQKELCLTIDSFNNAVEFLKEMGCTEKAYQESKREVWQIIETEICIDEWPFLEPFVEVEGPSEQEVKDVSEKLGFDYSQALFCAVGTIYAKKYGKYNIDEKRINNETPRIVFDMENPFVK
ncbi:MAG: CYTH domain-containing protein [Candidatus Pacebacteria bacterium]|nr:CYTH domain-containing protein [Candidatus Paceibacterota bacterium]